MLKWTLVDEKDAMEENKSYECLADALKDAEGIWSHLSEYDRQSRTTFLVGLCNVDEEGLYLEKDNGEYDVDVRAIAKTWIGETPSWIDRCTKYFNINMKDLSKKFGIPYRTIQNWSLGVNEAPIYLQDLIERTLWIDRETAELEAAKK